ncbi:peptidase inhibitor family I36 protein [Streptomyces sp. NPDC046915]|uniref:peptidase inhibitor family I36 protein n=1 Tax=Streptomyces sp. NPDC046915 TaxID=3155257 RepID=UPI0033DD7C7A
MPVTVYADVDYKGKSATLDHGRHKLDPSMNDCISSVRVPSGWKVTLYEHADFTGEKITLDADTRRVDGALHDKVSSIVVGQTDEWEDDGSYIFSAENGDNWFYFEDHTSGS